MVEQQGGFPAYQNSRRTRVVTQIGLWFFSAILASISVISGSPHFAAQMAAADQGSNAGGAAAMLTWPCLMILLRVFVFHTREFYIGLIAGVWWLLFSDLLEALYWAAAAALLISYVKYRIPALLLYAFAAGGLATLAYCDIYSFAQAPWLYAGYGVILIVGLFGKKLWASLKNLRLKKPVHTKTQPEAEENKVENSVDEAQLVFSLQLNALKIKGPLSAPLKEQVDGIVLFGERILQCMKEDPNDVQPGSDFLKRYLPITLNLVDNGQKLTEMMKVHGTSNALQEQSLQQLTALHSAFAQQHMRLLENDTLEFESDLTVLNSLLKTDGFKQ
ncbi:5-bromo-4-chloroindolyl phosphate hydrolysis family protein [Pseudomonas graminis]